jgi:dTMP kinase
MGLFITFEGNEGCGKSTQVPLLASRLRQFGRNVIELREPGGTPIGEEVRHTLKHSAHNEAMTPETELLLMNASRAQLVREIIEPALQSGHVVICDRFYDSTTAYQGYGRGLPLQVVKHITDFAVGTIRPDITFLLQLPLEITEARLRDRQANLPFVRDRMEQADRAFFARVSQGYDTIAEQEPCRIKKIDGTGDTTEVHQRIWEMLKPLLKAKLGFAPVPAVPN